MSFYQRSKMIYTGRRKQANRKRANRKRVNHKRVNHKRVNLSIQIRRSNLTPKVTTIVALRYIGQTEALYGTPDVIALTLKTRKT